MNINLNEAQNGLDRMSDELRKMSLNLDKADFFDGTKYDDVAVEGGHFLHDSMEFIAMATSLVEHAANRLSDLQSAIEESMVVDV